MSMTMRKFMEKVVTIFKIEVNYNGKITIYQEGNKDWETESIDAAQNQLDFLKKTYQGVDYKILASFSNNTECATKAAEFEYAVERTQTSSINPPIHPIDVNFYTSIVAGKDNRPFWSTDIKEVTNLLLSVNGVFPNDSLKIISRPAKPKIKPHKHAYLIAQWIQDTNQKVEVYDGTRWIVVQTPNWLESKEYRIRP